jgi:two-component system NtrC family response regulator
MSLKLRVLVVDDEQKQRALLAGFFQDLGMEVMEAADGCSALETVRSHLFDVVVTDYRMPGMNGRELLREIKKLNPEIDVVIVTAYGAVEDAVGCLKDGATEYLTKPVDLDEVEHVLERIAERGYLVREIKELKRRLGRFESVAGIVTAGGPMAEVLSTVARVARTPVSVLLTGESGTGKELVARAIHQAGNRSDEPFVTVNGSALSPSLLESELFGHEKGSFTGADRTRIGRFEAASGGTIFLDEIGDLPAEVQVKLLRVLQERTIERVGSTRPIPVDVRVISATHRDLPEEVQAGRFREDLYYRLAVVQLEIPALRSRRADIPRLVEHFAERYGEMAGATKVFSSEAMDLLVRYDYPGNVRELENIVQRALVLARGDAVTRHDLPDSVREGFSEGGLFPENPLSLPAQVAELERKMIEDALEEESGNQSRAADRLGISERTLRYKLSKIRIS